MRISLPQKISLSKMLIFCCLLLLLELVQGTTPMYAALVFCYFMLSALAFNVAGGFTRPSGAYIFYYGLLVAGLGTIYKAMLGQPAQTHLQAPVLVMSVYVATLCCLLLAAYFTRRLVAAPDGFAGVLHVPKLDFSSSALGCVVMVLFIRVASQFLTGAAGSIVRGMAMVNYFLPLSVLLGTIAAVRTSGGRRSTSVFTLCILAYSTFEGLLSFSKQGMFTPFVCWVLGMAWARFRLRMRHILAIVTFAIIAQTWMVPLANVGRVDMVIGSDEERLAITENYILHPTLLRQTNQERQAAYAGLALYYYGAPQGIFDRFTMLPNDSELMGYTAEGNYFGYLPVFYYFENWVPHIISPHKLEGIRVGGNTYAHELGELADGDFTTGISYSPSAEAFHLDGWRSVLLIQPLVFLLLFVVTDSVCGDLRAQPWGLVPLLLFAHVAPEQLLGGSINYVWLGNVGTTFAIFICGYVTPVFGRLLKGRERVPLWQNAVALPGSLNAEPERA